MVTQVGPLGTKLFNSSSGEGHLFAATTLRLLCGYEHFTTLTKYLTGELGGAGDSSGSFILLTPSPSLSNSAQILHNITFLLRFTRTKSLTLNVS